MVILPSHKPSLVETSPQQNTPPTALDEPPSPDRLSIGACSPTSTVEEDIVFNPIDDETSSKSRAVRRPEITSSKGAFSYPIRFKESPESCSISEIPKSSCTCTTAITHTGLIQDSDTTLKKNQSYFNQINAFTGSSSLSFIQSGSAYLTTTVSSTGSPYREAYSKVASAFGGSAIISQTHSPSHMYTPSKLHYSLGNTISSQWNLHLGIFSTSSSKNTPRCCQLHHLELNTIGTLSSFATGYHQAIQSPTIFSSPRLFPMTVQAVQSVKPVSSAVLFSPHKIPSYKPNEDASNAQKQSCGHQETKSQTAQKPVQRDDHSPLYVPSVDMLAFKFDASKLEHTTPGLNVNSFGQEPDHAHIPMVQLGTPSTTTDIFPVSPNVSIRKSAQINTKVTPQSSKWVWNGDQDIKTTPRADVDQLTASQQVAKSQQFFHSPVVIVRETQEVMTSSPLSSEARVSVNSPEIQPARGQPGVTTSPHIGPRSSESVRRKLELLEQKRAELARIRAQKAELKQKLKTENEMV